MKSASTSAVTAVGQVVTYTFVAKNTGNVTLTAVGITDTQTAPASALTTAPACQSLAARRAPARARRRRCAGAVGDVHRDRDGDPGRSEQRFAQRLGDGRRDPADRGAVDLRGVGGVDSGPDDRGDHGAKASTTTAVATVGQVVTYTFVAKNTGTVTLTGVGITDTQTAPASALTTNPACQSLSYASGDLQRGHGHLAPGQSATFTATATVTQADLNNGSLKDSATASGTPPTGAA